MYAPQIYFLALFSDPGQNQRDVYNEHLITGDLSEDDIDLAKAHGVLPTTDRDTKGFYGDGPGGDVYFAQPDPSQFTQPDSSQNGEVFGPGTFNPLPAVGVNFTPGETGGVPDRYTPKSDPGAVVRYTPSDPY